MKKAYKGIFVTTSDFTAEAIQTAHGLDKRLVLITGTQLSHLMVQQNVGCRIKNTVLCIFQVSAYNDYEAHEFLLTTQGSI